MDITVKTIISNPKICYINISHENHENMIILKLSNYYTRFVKSKFEIPGLKYLF